MTGGGSELAVGATSRKFLIHSCLGRGGFGEVYRATMTSAGGVRTEVAVKILRADIDPGSDSVKRLRDEGRLLGALSHPAILKVHDLVLLEGRVALVTEFVEGEDLDSALAADPPLPLRPLIGVVGEVGSALDVAFNAPSPQAGPKNGSPMHLVHRDVKPANVRLGRHGEVKLLDFGIARATNLDREAHTANNAMLGSYLYMAPERFHEEKVEPPSDVYSLGCVLFEGLTRHRLFDGMTLKQIYGVMLLSRKYNSHIEERMKMLPAETPTPVVDLLRSLLDVDPALRPTAGHLARLCEDLAESLDGPSLKRWARAREWPPQPYIAGSLDGKELSAESFDVGQPDKPRILTTPPPIRPPPAEPEAPVAPPPAAQPDLTIETTRLPQAPREATPSKPPATPFSSLLTLPSAPDALDAPVAGILSREIPRPSAEELEQLKREAEEPPAPASIKIATPNLPPRPSPVAHVSAQPPASPPAPPIPAVVDYVKTASTPPPARGPDTGIVDGWFVDQTPASSSPSPKPSLPLGPKMQALPPPVAPLSREKGPEIHVDTEIPLAPEPIPGVFDDPSGLHELDRLERAHLEDAGRRQRAALWAVIGMTAIGLVLVGALGLWVADRLANKLELPNEPAPSAPAPAPSAPAPADVAPADVAPAPAPAAPAPAAPAAPAPAAPAPAAPAPAPAKAKPAPKPAPPKPAPSKPSASALVDKGWKTVERDPRAALSLFDQALASDPKSAEGYYGRGYALSELSRNDEATSAFCKALKLASSKLAGEIRGVMKGRNLSCP